MYESNGRRAARRRKRRRRRRPTYPLLLLAGILGGACLLMGAKRAAEHSPAADPVTVSALWPQEREPANAEPPAGANAASDPETALAPDPAADPVKVSDLWPQEREPANAEPPAGANAASEPAPIPVSAPDPAPAPAAGDWNLILVNPWNALPEGYSVSLTQLKNGHAVDQRCYPELQAMMDACRAAGLSPVICSSYRAQETQERLFQNKVDRLVAKGYSAAEARAEAGKAVAVPGTSEHQLGLAVDIVDLDNQNLDESQEDTPVQKWLMAHSWEYGFILRYPSEKSERTGIIYEPWHYRYVGKPAAKEIYERGICLEEYLEERDAA